MSSYSLPDRRHLFPNIVDRLAVSHANEPALHSVGESTWSWSQLHNEGRTWASRLAHLGTRHGDIVATLAEAGLESVATWLGLTRLGAIEAAINTEFRGRILAYALNKCGARLILVQRAFLPILEAVADELTEARTVVLLDAADDDAPRALGSLPLQRLHDIPADPEQAELHRHEPDWHDIACVTYTSGTTGPSKAVRLPWAQLHSINLGTLPFEDLGAHDVIYSLSPNAHFGSKLMPYLAGMIGGQVVMRKRFSAAEFWGDVARYRVTTAAIVGPMAEMLMRSPDGPGPETSLRNLFMAPMLKDYARFNERFGTRLCTIYNSTEGGVAIRSQWNPADWRGCGRLRDGYPGFEVRIVDEHDCEVPDGVVGEAIIRSSVPWTMNAGYLNDGEATARAWRNGWFHTGDGLKRSRDGEYFFVDRVKDAIRRRGENISSFEVEADVMQHPDVLECAAVAVPAEGGEDEILLFVVPRPESGLTQEKLLRDLMPRMARFMVPRYLDFIDALPRTDATRRVKKSELRQRGLGAGTFDRIKVGIEIPRG
jgi:crotonobetaine/carnitine-CoA ligase